MIRKPLFFTTPLRGIKYHWVIYNLYYIWENKNETKRIIEHEPKIVILDSGVNYIFGKLKLKDYPKWYLENYTKIAEYVSRIIKQKTNAEVWVTCPDYPDDEHPGLVENNVEKTIENWIKIAKNYQPKNFKWLIVIQSRYKDLESFKYCLEKAKEIWDGYDLFGIGTVCKIKDVKLIEKFVKLARKELGKNVWLHAFGPTMKSIRYIVKYIDSFDSITIWHEALKGGYKNSKEVWDRFMKKWDKVINNRSLFEYLE